MLQKYNIFQNHHFPSCKKIPSLRIEGISLSFTLFPPPTASSRAPRAVGSRGRELRGRRRRR